MFVSEISCGSQENLILQKIIHIRIIEVKNWDRYYFTSGTWQSVAVPSGALGISACSKCFQWNSRFRSAEQGRVLHLYYKVEMCLIKQHELQLAQLQWIIAGSAISLSAVNQHFKTTYCLGGRRQWFRTRLKRVTWCLQLHLRWMSVGTLVCFPHCGYDKNKLQCLEELRQGLSRLNHNISFRMRCIWK